MNNLFGTILNFFYTYEIRISNLHVKTDEHGRLSECTGVILLSNTMPTKMRRLIEKEYKQMADKDFRMYGSELKLDKEKFNIVMVTKLELNEKS